MSQAPVASKIVDPRALLGKRIVTSFPHLTEQYYKQLGGGDLKGTTIRYVINEQHPTVATVLAYNNLHCCSGFGFIYFSPYHHRWHLLAASPYSRARSCVSGSVEAACALGLADGIVDLVETGTTMVAAGLGIVDTIMPTQTVLISNPKSKKVGAVCVCVVLCRFSCFLRHCWCSRRACYWAR